MRITEELARLAEMRRTARIRYRRPRGGPAACRVVEPYQLLEEDAHLLLHAWQVEPKLGSHAWRNFRIDRIVEVSDGGDSFEPRCVVTLRRGMLDAIDEGVASDQADATERYACCLEQALLDGVDLNQAKSLASELLPSQLRAVHGRVFASVVQEVALDQEMWPLGMDYLGDVRESLGALGWAP